MTNKTTKISEITQRKHLNVDAELINMLEMECPKDEFGYREESYTTQIKRLIAPTIQKQNKQKAGGK